MEPRVAPHHIELGGAPCADGCIQDLSTIGIIKCGDCLRIMGNQPITEDDQKKLDMCKEQGHIEDISQLGIIKCSRCGVHYGLWDPMGID
ncbi:MAG: hypothetical protein ACR2KZ_17570 [Segetibacter sp.]